MNRLLLPGVPRREPERIGGFIGAGAHLDRKAGERADERVVWPGGVQPGDEVREGTPDTDRGR